MKNNGKVFENEFKSCIPGWCYFLRLVDGTGGFAGTKNENVRFQAKNLCDCIAVGNEYTYFMELKNTEDTSLPFKNIKEQQWRGLGEINHSRIKAYFVVCFRQKERCFFVEAKKIKDYIEAAERKSFPLSWFEENGIEIEMIKKRVKYKYNLENILI